MMSQDDAWDGCWGKLSCIRKTSCWRGTCDFNYFEEHFWVPKILSNWGATDKYKSRRREEVYFCLIIWVVYFTFYLYLLQLLRSSNCVLVQLTDILIGISSDFSDDLSSMGFYCLFLQENGQSPWLIVEWHSASIPWAFTWNNSNITNNFV